MSPSQLLTAAELDRDQLRRLAGISDEAGVLTIVVGHDPSRPEESRAAELAVKGGLRDAIASCEGELRERLTARVEQIAVDVEALVDPTSFGRGRILVTPLVEDAPIDVVRVQAPVDHRVVVAEHAWIRPLASLWARHRPVRVLMVDQGGLRVLDWAMGQVQDRWEREVSFGDAQLADVKKGPSATAHMRGSVNREAFSARLDENRSRILRDALSEAIGQARERGIERVLVMGSPKVRDLVSGALQGTDVTIWTDDRDLSQSPDDAVLEAVEQHVLEGYVRESEDLIRAVLDTEAAGGPAVRGLAAVVNALNQGRVDTLVVSTDADVRGYVTDDGLLAVNPGPERDRDPEPYLVDRTVATALLTDARVVTVPDEQAAQLGDEGIGALLRW